MNKHWIIWMGLAAALVLVAAGCASPGVPQQAADAETVFRNITVALNEKNVDQAIAWVADDCVLTIVPPPPGGTGVYRGKAQILARFKEVVGVNANHVLSNVKMNGEQVTWQASYTDDTLKPAGLSSLEFTGQALVQGGQAKSITWTLTPASLAKLQAAMAPPPTPIASQPPADVLVATKPPAGPDAETVFRNITVALNEKKVDQAIAWVADDCVLTIIPPPPNGSGVYQGKAQILARFKEVVGVNANHVLSNVKMNGEQVTWQASYTDDTLKPAGLSSLEFTGQALVQGGLAKSITWTLTPASLAKLQAAMAPTPTPLPPLGLEKLVSRPEDLIGVWKVIFIEGAGVGQLEFKQDGTYTLVGVEGNATGAYVDSGKFRVEGKQLKLIPTGGCLTPMGETVNPCIGIYQAYVARRAGQPAQLRLVGVEDPAHDRWRTYNNKTFPVVNTPVK